MSSGKVIVCSSRSPLAKCFRVVLGFNMLNNPVRNVVKGSTFGTILGDYWI